MDSQDLQNVQNNIYKLGFELLDQTPTVEKEKDYEPTFEPTKEVILKRIDRIKKFSDHMSNF